MNARIGEHSSAARDPLTGQPPGSVIETKEFLRTSEFWTTVAVVIGIVMVALSNENLDAGRATLLTTILAASYIVSRGIAKAGSAHPFWGREMHFNSGRNRSNSDEQSVTGSGSGQVSSSDSTELLRRIEARLDRLERTSTGRVTTL